MDENGQQRVTEITFSVLSGDKEVFNAKIHPMYVRGRKAKGVYWENEIDSYSAHAGSGQISISGLSHGGQGWDAWNEVLVQPKLDYIELNHLSQGAKIGLHRHEKNQEIYLVSEGQLQVQNGVANRSSATYSIQKQWNDFGESQQTDQFDANQGWIENRTLQQGDLFIFVPHPGQSANGKVFFHGAWAETATNFFTLGAKN